MTRILKSISDVTLSRITCFLKISFYYGMKYLTYKYTNEKDKYLNNCGNSLFVAKIF